MADYTEYEGKIIEKTMLGTNPNNPSTIDDVLSVVIDCKEKACALFDNSYDTSSKVVPHEAIRWDLMKVINDLNVGDNIHMVGIEMYNKVLAVTSYSHISNTLTYVGIAAAGLASAAVAIGAYLRNKKKSKKE